MKTPSLMTKLCVFVVAGFVSVTSRSSAREVAMMYWSQEFRENAESPYVLGLWRGELVDGQVINSVELLKPVYAAGGVAVHQGKGKIFDKIFWASADERSIQVADLNDPNRIAQPFPGPHGPGVPSQYLTGVALDSDRERLFWSSSAVSGEDTKGSISYAYTDGRAENPVITIYQDESIAQVSGITLDTKKGQRRVYWIAATLTSGVGLLQGMKIDSPALKPDISIEVTVNAPSSLTFVPSQETFYWADYGSVGIGWARLKKAQLVDQGFIPLPPGHPFPVSVFADVNAMRLYVGFRPPSGVVPMMWMDLRDGTFHELAGSSNALGIEVVHTK